MRTLQVARVGRIYIYCVHQYTCVGSRPGSVSGGIGDRWGGYGNCYDAWRWRGGSFPSDRILVAPDEPSVYIDYVSSYFTSNVVRVLSIIPKAENGIRANPIKTMHLAVYGSMAVCNILDVWNRGGSSNRGSVACAHVHTGYVCFL